MSLFVKFWGTRGSIPTPGSSTAKYGGNTACIEIRAGDKLFVCDGGSGLRELGMDVMRRGKGPFEAHLFFSHAHWDHIQGFPFFTPAYIPTNSCIIYGQQVGGRTMHSLLSGQMQHEYFPVSFSDLGASMRHGDLPDELVIGGARITHHKQWHPGNSLAYSFEYEGKKVVYATDSELDLALLNPDEVDRDKAAFRELPRELVEFMRGADLLIADGQYLDEEYEKKRGWGHPRVGTVVDLAIAAGIKQLAITHHDPMHTDRDVDHKIAVCQERAARRPHGPQVFGARESFELKLA